MVAMGAGAGKLVALNFHRLNGIVTVIAIEGNVGFALAVGIRELLCPRTGTLRNANPATAQVTGFDAERIAQL
jgi:hypothetical protein